jgi:glutamate formiminotransferase
MNLVEIDRSGIQDACLHVRELAQARGTDVASVELVGLIPRREVDRCNDDFLEWSGIDATSTIEARIGNGPRWWPGDPRPDSEATS